MRVKLGGVGWMSEWVVDRDTLASFVNHDCPCRLRTLIL